MPVIDRRTFVAAAVSGVGAACCSAGAPIAPLVGRGRVTNETTPILPWDQLRPGVWVPPSDLSGGNVAVIASAGRAVVIDSKFASVAGALMHAASAFAEAPADGVRITLVTTHHHGDHTSGNATFAHSGATLVAHINATPRIAGQVDRYRASLASAEEAARGIDASNERLIELAAAQAALSTNLRPSSSVPMVAIGEHAELQVPTMPIELRHFGPGHTDNDLVARIDSQNVVHTGDLVFNGLHPFFDASAGVTARGWIESLRAVEQLCDEEPIDEPGHEPLRHDNLKRAQRSYIEQLINAVEQAQASGSSKEATTEQVFDFMEGLGFDRIRPIAIGVVWDQVVAGL